MTNCKLHGKKPIFCRICVEDAIKYSKDDTITQIENIIHEETDYTPTQDKADPVFGVINGHILRTRIAELKKKCA